MVPASISAGSAPAIAPGGGVAGPMLGVGKAGICNAGGPVRVGTCTVEVAGGFGPMVWALALAGSGMGVTTGLTMVALLTMGCVFVPGATSMFVPRPAKFVGPASGRALSGRLGPGMVGGGAKVFVLRRTARARAATELVSMATLVWAGASRASAAARRRKIGFITYLLEGLAELVEGVLTGR